MHLSLFLFFIPIEWNKRLSIINSKNLLVAKFIEFKIFSVTFLIHKHQLCEYNIFVSHYY